MLPKYARVAARNTRRSHALAGRAEDDVTATWYPLGYNIRPRRLQTIAREAVARYGGQLPADEATLLSFKGIGAYTAGAIRSFAFGQRAAILDTNVARVLFRVFVGTRRSEGATRCRRHLWAVSARRPAAAPRVRLQPGADGLRRARSAPPATRGARRARWRRTAVPRGERAAAAAAAHAVDEATRSSSPPRVVERGGRLLVTRRPEGRPPRRAAGSFPAASASRARRSRPASRAS